MNKLIVVLLFMIGMPEVFASSCGLPPIEVFNNTRNKIVIGFDLRFDKFEPIEHKDKSLKEFLSHEGEVLILEPWSYKQLSLSFGCGYGPSPKDFWFGYKVWGNLEQHVTRYSQGKMVVIDKSHNKFKNFRSLRSLGRAENARPF